MQDTTAAFIHLLGTARVTLGAASQPFAPDKRHQLLAYLACQGDWVERERLAALFWPDHAPGAARANLRQLLTLVRGLGWAAGLEVEGRRLRWAVGTDLSAFQRAVAEQDWASALACYGGPLLDGLDGDGAGEFAAWLDLERRRAHDAWRTALLGRAGELSRDGAHLGAAELLAPLLEGDELDEEALHAHVSALWRAGGREQARRTHAAFVERLREELGLGPTAELEALGQALREGRGPKPGRPFPAPDAPGPSLPSAPTSFTGRDLELTEITRRLSGQGCRLLTLVGPGGIGKTRLALEAARGLAGRHPDGVFFVPLEALGDSALLAPGLASALGLALQGQTDPAEQVARWIGQRRFLLVLDNFEHLLDGVALVPNLLRRCPEVRLLVTSHERLGVEGEWLLPVEGLDYPRDGEPGSAEGAYFDAVQLFVERARRVRPGFRPDPETFPHLLQICRLVEGSPLGLELAAVWVRLLPLSQIALEIGENLDFLSGGRGRSERHVSLRAVFEHSWRRLTPLEQEVLRQLAVFRGGFRLEAARQVAGATLAVLAALTDKSLLRLSPGGRYDRHALVSGYTRERLAEHPGEEAGAREQHGRSFLSLLASLGETIHGPDGPAALRALDEELENIRAAWQWAVAGRRAEELGRAALPGLRYFNSRARYREGFALYGEAAAALQGGEGADVHPLALGLVLTAQGWFGMFLGRYHEAARLAERGLALVPPEHVAVRHNHNTLGNIAERNGHYAEAGRRYRRALAWSEGVGDEAGQAAILPNLAGVEVTLGHLDEAERHARRTLALCGHLGLRVTALYGLNVQGTVAWAAGRLEEARAVFGQGLGLARDIGLPEQIACFLLGLAHVAFEGGDADEARRLGEEGLAGRTRAGLTEEISLLALLGRVSAALGEDEDAHARLGESLRLALAHGETPRLLEGLVYLAELWVKRGRAREAAPLLHLARAHPSTDYRVGGLARRRLAELDLPAGEAAEAQALGEPGRLEALTRQALAWLDLTGLPRSR